MRNETREAFDAWSQQVAKLNGVKTASQEFTVEPSVQQRLESKIQESDAFLRMINVVGVDQMKGDRLALGVAGPIAKRTDTSQSDRKPSDVTELAEMRYECVHTEFDSAIPWSKLDAWAKFPDFQRRVTDMVARQQGLDRLAIGFGGTHAAAATDSEAFPGLEDVNKGWLELYRQHAPERVLFEGSKAPGELRVGPGGDYKNLDALIFDAVNEMIAPWHRESLEMKVIAGRSLLPAKYFQMISEHGKTPSEMLALENSMFSNARFGRLQAVRTGPMPAGKIFITMPENLSLYWQRGSRRRYVVDNPRRNRIEDYQSSNDAYVVEDFGAGCLLENVVFGDWR